MREEKADRYAQLALRFHGSEGSFELVVGLANLAEVREAFARRGYEATPTERPGGLWIEKLKETQAEPEPLSPEKVALAGRVALVILKYIHRNLMSNAVAAANLDASPEEIYLLRAGRHAELPLDRLRQMIRRLAEEEAARLT